MDEDDVIEIIPDEDSPTSTPQGQERNVWNAQAVHLLIKEYKKHRTNFVNPEIRRKRLWLKISSKLQAYGYNFDADQCEKKWRNLKTYYLTNEGKTIITWPFYQAMRNALEGDQSPRFKNVKVPEENGESLPLEVQIETQKESILIQEEHEDVDDIAPPSWFARFLIQYKEDEAKKMKMLEEMHNNIVELENRKCLLLQTLIEKLT